MYEHGLFSKLSQGVETIESDILTLEETPEDVALLQRILQALGVENAFPNSEDARKIMQALREGRIQPNHETVDALLGVLEAVKQLFYLTAGCAGGLCFDAETSEPAHEERDAPAPPAPEEGAPFEQGEDRPEPQAEAAKTAPVQEQKQREQQFLKVRTGKLDDLMEGVQELVISSSMLAQQLEASDGAAGATLQEHDRRIEDLRKHVLDIRRVGMRATFTRMTRLVREVATATDKEAQLLAEGENVEADKSLVDELADPLVHIIRNAVDHGLETPDAREAAGKQRTGTVRMVASERGGELTLIVEDDGRGLDRERILEKALERGLVKPGQTLTDSEVFGMILHPGFSTAKVVSNVSGRGVGMDVVSRAIQALQGELDISSEKGVGTRFTIRMPTDRASLEGITQGLLLAIGEQRFVLRSGCVREVFNPDPGSVHVMAEEGEVIHARAGTFPFYRLHCLLHITPRYKAPEKGLGIVVEASGRKIVLLVDDVLGERQVVVRTFTAMHHFLGESLFSGVAFIGSTTAMILDAEAMLAICDQDDFYLQLRFGAGAEVKVGE